MKRLLLCLASTVVVSSCFEELNAGLFSSKSDSSAETAADVLFGIADIADAIKKASAMKSEYDNAKSKFSSAATAILKYSTDQKAFADKDKNDVSMIPMLYSIMALAAGCFETASKAFGLIKDGLDDIKSAKKDTKGKKATSGRKAVEQGIQLIETMRFYRITLDIAISTLIQMMAKKKAEAVRKSDIQKEFKKLTDLNDAKKKLIGTNQNGLSVTAKDLHEAAGTLTNGDMKQSTEKLVKSTEDLGATVEIIYELIPNIFDKDKLNKLNETCNSDKAEACKKR
ncbi:hypothetical protein FACS189472_11760 [Alphaproteobacteria bacterium]|nr:hypothetical protein FACS189472_11760 [Alphaproteobacteria bacterium]